MFSRMRLRKATAIRTQVNQATIDALTSSLAIIEFDLDGNVLTANQNFLQIFDYELREIVGQHHRMFVDNDIDTDEYRQFWVDLRQGKFQANQYLRLAKGSRPVWIQAAYNPILGHDGKPSKIIKIASDVTAAKVAAIDAVGQLSAISKSQAVIEFSLSGEILDANANFCQALGYTIDEIRGKHHSVFVEPDYARSADYAKFWQDLRDGKYQAAEFLRIGKDGRQVWIQASYNPIIDSTGEPYKIVKYATDVTGRKTAVDAIGVALTRVSNGNLDARIEHPFPAELETVRTALNETVEKFTGIVSSLRTSSGSLRSATAEILSGTNDLANRTSKQAASIEETNAAMEQLTKTVAENAKRTTVANTSASEVSTAAVGAGEIIGKANEAMERIAASSAKISNIIGMIDDIAFQTNLLALNASVEAARAGDAGKGFAVVAVEVRRLAQSAASASSDVKTLIDQAAQEVGIGTRLVADATNKVDQVLQGIHESADLIESIATVTREQAASIMQVGSAIRDMDEMTQHNAALVEETNAAVEQTEAQAVELDRLVEVFVIAGQSAPERKIRQLATKPVIRPMPKVVGQDWSEF